MNKTIHEVPGENHALATKCEGEITAEASKRKQPQDIGKNLRERASAAMGEYSCFNENDRTASTRGKYQKGRIELMFNSDATPKRCCLTYRQFVPPVPMAFFFNGDRSSPVCPFYACKTGFITHPADLFLILKILSKEDILTRAVPRGSKFADWYSDVWSYYNGSDHAHNSLRQNADNSESTRNVNEQAIRFN